MSTTIDQRVVEMRFDNQHFERNVSNTMSTLDKLKQRLNFSGASKGLENVSTAAKNVDMNGLGNAVDTVRTRFSAMEVMGVTALANITNSAVNAGKRMISALTIDPVKTGFSEYETKINAIQTIMSNTSSKGTTMDDVTATLNKLNTYADKTIYNFAEMTRNIGTFTAAGVGLEESASAIQGIANLAAASGSNSQQASTAMYQLSQALAAGTVKLMDWNSVVNAGMGGEKFQEALKATAREHGIAVDQIIKDNGSFRDSLQEGWISADILNETLRKFTVEGAKEYADAMVKSGKYTKEQADALVKEAQSMEDAATKVKTFTQLWDTLKESAQSGWAQTWELLVGDFEEAKSVLSDLSAFLGGFIDKMSDARNTLLGGAIDPAGTWTKITDKLKNSGLGSGINKIKEISEAVGEVTDKLEYFQDVVDKVWRGDYKNSDTGRFEMLEAAGYDHRVVQDLVNKGYNYKLTVEDIEASHKKFGLTMEKTASGTEKATEAFVELSDEQLKNAGLTEAEIKLYRELEAEAKRTGISIDELVDKMSKKDGRTMLIESLKNAGSGLVGVFTALKNAWVETFPPPTVFQVYNLIEAINTFSEKLRLTDKDTGKLTDTAKKLQRTFKGVFALVDIVATILGGGLRIAIKAVSALLGYFDLDILDVTAAIGDALVKFRDWVDGVLDFNKVFEKIGPYIEKAAKAIRDFFKGIPKNDILGGLASKLKSAAEAIRDWFSGIKEADNIPGYLIQGFVNGLKEGLTLAVKGIWELGTSILEAFREVLGIHSPSTETHEDGKNFVLGFVEGIAEFAKQAWDAIKSFGASCIDLIKKIDFGKVFAVAVSLGMVWFIKKISDAVSAITAPLEGLGDLFSDVGVGVKRFLTGAKKALKGLGNYLNSKAILNIAISIGILAASVALLTLVDQDKLHSAVNAILVLATVIVVLAAVASRLSNIGTLTDSGKVAGVAASLLLISGSLLIIAIAAKKIAEMSTRELYKAGAGIAAIVAAIALLMTITMIPGNNLDQIGGMLLKVSGAFLILTLVAKMIAKMSWEDIAKASAGILGFVGVVALLMTISMIPGKYFYSIGAVLMKIAGAFLILTIVAKIIAGMSWGDLGKAGVGIAGIIAVVALLMTISMIPGKNINDIGKMLLGISGAMIILAITAKLIAGMSWEEMGKAAVGLVGLVGIVALLVLITKLAGNDTPKIALTLLAMSAAIGILAAVAIVLGLVNLGGLAKGIVAVGLLSAMMALMIYATRGASECKGNLIVMTVAIAVMAAAVAALSMIDFSKLAGATLAMGTLMGMFALLVREAGKAQGSMATLIVMTVAIGVMGGLLYLLSGLPIESTIGSAVALSTLILAVSGALFLLSKSNMTIVDSLKAVLALTLMAVPLAAFVGVLALMSGIQNATQNAIALSLLASVMSLLLIPLSLVGSLVGSALLGVLALTAMAVPLIAFVGVLAVMSLIGDATNNVILLTTMATVLTLLLIPLTLIGALVPAALLGVLALTAMAVPLLAFVGVLALMQNIQNAEENTNLLIGLMETMTAMLVVLAIVGPLALIGVTAMAGLTALMVAVGALAVAVGALMTEFPALEEFLNRGIPILEKLAYAVGSMVGNLIAGFMDGALSSLPQIGTYLSEFMINAQPFIAGAKLVDESVLSGVKALAGAVLLLTAADLVAGVASFLQGGSSFATLGTELSQFMLNAMPFITSAAMLNTDMMTGVKALADTILILTAANVVEGLTSWFAGSSSLAEFGSQLAGLGTNLNQFVTNIGTFSEDQVNTVTCAANAVKALAQAADQIPNEGGWAAALLGENSIATFGSYLPTLGVHLSGFVANLGTFTEDQVTTVDCAGRAIKALAEAANEIPNEGGWAAKMFGDNSIATFGSKLPGLGTNLAGFVTNLGTFSDEQVATVDCAGKAIKAMADAASSIDGQAEWAKKIFGDNSLSAFGGEMASLGTNLKSFASNLGTFDDAKVTTVKYAVKAINALSGLANSDLSGAKKNLEGFGDKIIQLAKDVSSFISEMPSKDSITKAVDNLNKILDAIDDIAGADATIASEFTKALKDIGKDGVKNFVEAFTSKSATEDVKQAAKDLMSKIIDGFKDKSKDVKTEAEEVAKDGAKGVSSQKQAFYDAGSALVTGFANGIDANSFKAVAKARAMAKAAKQAAEEALGIASPSKVFYRIGAYSGEGFINALDDYASISYKSSSAMADSARRGLSDAISKISNIISNGVDSEPTIRPVVDLSNVRTGVDAIGDMLDMGSSVGVMARVGTVNSMMNRYSQNGNNSDVVSAINKLREGLSNVGNTTYHIDGVTYDDGSNISEAVKTIIGAAKRERRV